MTYIRPTQLIDEKQFNLAEHGAEFAHFASTLYNAQSGLGDPGDLSNYFGVTTFKPLDNNTISTLFRKNKIAQKIIKLYPEDGIDIGYQVKKIKESKDGKPGEIIEEDDDLILKIMKEASIYARLYRICFVYLIYENDDKPYRPIPEDTWGKVERKIVDYKLFGTMDDLQRDGYWGKNDVAYHEDRILIFYGSKNYIPLDVEEGYDDINYTSDSVFDNIWNDLTEFLDSKKAAKSILDNLSYLVLGFQGFNAACSNENGLKAVLKKLSIFNKQRHINRVIPRDMEDDFNFVSQTLTGVREILEEFKILIAASTDYPYDQLFATTPSQNLSSSGIQNQLIARFLWAKKVVKWIKNNWADNYKKIFDIKYGRDNYKLHIPLKIDLSEQEKAELQKTAAEELEKLIGAGIIIPEEGRVRFEGEEFDLNIVLDKAAFEKDKEDKKKQQEMLANGFNSGDNNQNPNNSNRQSNSSNGRSNNTQQDANFDANLSDDEWNELANLTLVDIEELGAEISNFNNSR